MTYDYNCGDCPRDPMEDLTNDELIEALQVSLVYNNGITEDHIVKLEELVDTYKHREGE